MAQQIQIRHDTAANWTSANPTLAIGEMGAETDTSKFKIGNGSTAWASLAYVGVVSSVAGRTGVVTLAKADISGIGSVDNTSDAAKPVSAATQTALDLKAPLASPTLTGTPIAPTATAATNTTQIATTAFVRGEVAALVASSPASLDTLNELAAALGNDASFATTVTSNLSLKAPLASPSLTGTPTVPTASVGTSTTQAASTAFVQAAVARPAQNDQTGTAYTFVLADDGRLVTAANAASQTYTVPPQASVAWSAGAEIRVISLGDGVVTFAAGGGVTVDEIDGNLSLAGKFAGAVLQRVGTNHWVIIGRTT